MNETLDLRGRGPDARKQRARDLPSRESIQLTLRVLRTLKVPHQIRHRQAQRHQRDQRVVQFERRDGADEQRGPRDGASVQRRPEESLLVRAHARHALVVPRLEPPPRLPGVVYLVPIPQTDEQASADVLAPPKIDREREDARHEICDETVRIDEFARQVRRDRRHLQRQRHRRRRGVRLDVGRDGHRGHAARRGAKCRRTRAPALARVATEASHAVARRTAARHRRVGRDARSNDASASRDARGRERGSGAVTVSSGSIVGSDRLDASAPARRVGTRSTEDAIGATRKMKHGALVAAPGHAEAQADPGPTTSPPIVTKEMVQAAVDKVARDTNKMSKRKSATRGASADGKKKPRKPYTQTRARVSWTPKEHQRFLRALELYSRDWKRIEEYVGSKDVVQIRSHAQKHFLKLMKSGQGDQMPPPRHKKSNHADGERAVNYVPGMSQAMRLRLQVEPDGSLPVAPKRAPGVPPPLQNSTNTPDFATVYGFLADLFKVNEARTEPEHALRLSNAHTTPLENMTAIDRETALLLIRNLRNNMCSKQMWQQQSDLLEDGCSTFLDAQDAERLRSKTFGKVSDASPDDNSSGDGSGDGSGGASNEALQSDIIA